MIKFKSVIYHLRKKTMSNVYISNLELDELVRELTTVELRLYILIHNSILENPNVDFFSDSNISARLNIPIGSIRNAKTALKNKGYMLLVKFKDETGTPCIRVIVGKEQVELYNLGIKGEVTNLKGFDKLKQQFGLSDPTLSQNQKLEAVRKFNEYYENNKEEFMK